MFTFNYTLIRLILKIIFQKLNQLSIFINNLSFSRFFYFYDSELYILYLFFKIIYNYYSKNEIFEIKLFLYIN